MKQKKRQNQPASISSFLFARREGFLLLELVLATLFVSIALVGVFDGFRTVIQAEKVIDVEKRASILLQARVWELQRDGVFQEGIQQGGFPHDTDFTWETATQGTEIPDLYRIQVTVQGNGEDMKALVYLRERNDR